MRVTNWGKYPVVDVPTSAYREQALPLDGHWIARGQGRCYGDSALGSHVLQTHRHNRLLHFDEQKGILVAEAGVSFADMLTHFVPLGWFPPVTPGTKFVSLGGAIASDVHGKNHHVAGTLSAHVHALELRTPTGEIIRCGPHIQSDIFWATVGGMGLTGLITQVTLQMRPIETTAIQVEEIKAAHLEEIIELFDTFEQTPYSVAWIDVLKRGKGLGRSILMQGDHASREEVKESRWEKQALHIPRKPAITVPFDFPGFTLNNLTIGAFNTLYYAKRQRKRRQMLTDYEAFFYPLDSLHHWNRIYGKRGFTQYQFVLPREVGAKGVREVLMRIHKARMGSFLSVLKLFGAEGKGLLSFPIPGYTLTLDFPISQRLFPFLDELDRIVLDYGGRVYLTKDVRLSAETFEKMYPRLPEFRAIRKQLDPEGRLQSLQSQRLGL